MSGDRGGNFCAETIKNGKGEIVICGGGRQRTDLLKEPGKRCTDVSMAVDLGSASTLLTKPFIAFSMDAESCAIKVPVAAKSMVSWRRPMS